MKCLFEVTTRKFFYIFAIYFAPGIDGDRADTCDANILCSLSMNAEMSSRVKMEFDGKWFSSQTQFRRAQKKRWAKFIRSEGSFISSNFSWVHLNISPTPLSWQTLFWRGGGKIKSQKECHKNSFIPRATSGFSFPPLEKSWKRAEISLKSECAMKILRELSIESKTPLVCAPPCNHDMLNNANTRESQHHGSCCLSYDRNATLRLFQFLRLLFFPSPPNTSQAKFYRIIAPIALIPRRVNCPWNSLLSLGNSNIFT